jgi:rare lipoprotein A
MKTTLILGTVAIALALGGCGSNQPVPEPARKVPPATQPTRGGYYLDDGPQVNPPPNLDAIPDAVPHEEPLHRFANRTYAVLGNTYTPNTGRRTHSEEGLASWYGRRFHGKKTASGELYDMYAMTAAHPTLPIPSYVRVTVLGTGKTVVVRINDRGPFHSKRIIDLSYTAAYKLGFIKKGSERVRVERLDSRTSNTQGDALRDGVYLQVGAYSRPENAQQMRERLAHALELDASRTHVVLNGTLHRVHLGPYPSDDDARADRERVRERLDLNAVLVRQE